MASNLALQLKDFNFSDLLQSEGLQRLDETFLKFLKEKNNDLFERLLAYRQESSFTNLEISELIIAAAKILELTFPAISSLCASDNETKTC